jgi:hypothetical protein
LWPINKAPHNISFSTPTDADLTRSRLALGINEHALPRISRIPTPSSKIGDALILEASALQIRDFLGAQGIYEHNQN